MRALVEGLVFFEKLIEDLFELIDWPDQRLFLKTRVNAVSFFWSSFPKNQQVICKKEVVYSYGVSGNFQTF